jgi:hypothetical protein
MLVDVNMQADIINLQTFRSYSDIQEFTRKMYSAHLAGVKMPPFAGLMSYEWKPLRRDDAPPRPRFHEATMADIKRDSEILKAMEVPTGYMIESTERQRYTLRRSPEIDFGPPRGFAVAGGAAMNSLRAMVNPAMRHRTRCSDVDLFPIGETAGKEIDLILSVRWFGSEDPKQMVMIRSDHTLTVCDITAPKYMPTQIVLHRSDSLSQLLYLFDIDASACAIYAGRIWFTPACLFSLVHNVVVIDHIRLDAGYAARVCRYVDHKFMMAIVPELQWNRLDHQLLSRRKGLGMMFGEIAPWGESLGSYYGVTVLMADDAESSRAKKFVGAADLPASRGTISSMLAGDLMIPASKPKSFDDYLAGLHFPPDYSRGFGHTIDLRLRNIADLSMVDRRDWFCTSRLISDQLDEVFPAELSDIIRLYEKSQ